MEKRKPTYDLSLFQKRFSSVGRLYLTGAALRGAAALGFGRAEIVATLQTMRTSHFYKSMTSVADHQVWQDVYYVPSVEGLLYIKFSADAVHEFLLLSFKENDNG